MRNITCLIVYALIIISGLIAHHRIVTKALDMSTTVTEKHLQNVMLEHEERLRADLNFIVDSMNAESDTLAMLNSLSQRDGYSFYIFSDDNLCAWSNASIPISMLTPDKLSTRILHTENGWYYVLERRMNRNSYFAVLRLRAQYQYTNEYLAPDFDESLGISAQSEIFSDASISDCCKITDREGRYLFSIKQRGTGQLTVSQQIADMSVLVMILVATLILLSGCYRMAIKHIKPVWALLGFAAVLITLYFCSISIVAAPPMNDWFLFSPQVFAYSTYMPCLAQAAIAAVFLVQICYYIHFSLDLKLPSRTRPHARRSKFIVASLVLLIPLAVFLIANEILELLVLHSSDLLIYIGELDISPSSLTKVVTISLVYLAYALTLNAVYNNLSKSLSIQMYLSAVVLNSCFFFIEQMLIEHTINWVMFIGYWGSSIPYYFIKRREGRRIEFSRFIWFTLAVAFYFVIRLTMLNGYKEAQNRDLLLANLSFQLMREDDPVAEQLLSNNEYNIANDTLIKQTFALNLSDAETAMRIYDHVREKYFNGYLTRYELQVVVCRNDQSKLEVTGTGEEYNCFDYFRSMVSTYGSLINPQSLIYKLNDDDGRAGYFGVFTYADGAYMFVEINEKESSQDVGYPELLTNSRDRLNMEQYKDYSYAKYCDGVLFYRYGDFEYSRNYVLPVTGKPDDVKEVVADGYSHKIYFAQNNQIIVLSYPQITLSRVLVDYSYLFICMLIVCLIANVILSRNGDFLYGKMSINERIQTTFVLFVITLLVVFCVLAGFDSYSRYEEQSHKQMSQKLESVRNILLQRIDDLDDEASTDNVLQYASALFNLDAHLFSPEGRLKGTSRRELFANGISAPLINSEALQILRNSDRFELFINERIGELLHLSLYAPLIDANGTLLGYVNVPYFSDIKDMREKVLSTFVPITNTYLIIILMAIFLSHLVAVSITRPLITISNKIKQVSLQNKNEKIEYAHPDEIGVLVNEYNRMLDELERSAEQLALSERESTWREMARQISHEIRNPLTPMKLSVQYMQRAWEDKRPDFDNMLKKTTHTLIEQIDQLSFIASQFSNLAKTPNGEAVYVDVVERVEGTVLIFNNTENASVTLTKSMQHAIVLINPDQLTSVFNNLIKNALQSGKGDDFVEVKVDITADDENVIISVADNGRGIDPEVQEKIFKPNFTTKSTGMGLGLAIVKNIIVGAKGEIFFETKLGQGTTFIVKLPLVVSN
ncbi:MAG: HAMP domain-containing histidine kinase [Bacteroidales bacterium]|nr:HAMP domain-containing histidine kinase [Bacteroidales bacterium]